MVGTNLQATPRRLIVAAAALGLVALLSACGGSGGGGGNPPPDVPPSGVGRFGVGFAAAFAAAANSDPREVTAADVIPISLTTDPIEVP